MEARAKQSAQKAEELEDRLIDFALRIGSAAEALPPTKLGKHIAAQIIRCGTSPAPNYGEANRGEAGTISFTSWASFSKSFVKPGSGSR